MTAPTPTPEQASWIGQILSERTSGWIFAAAALGVLSYFVIGPVVQHQLDEAAKASEHQRKTDLAIQARIWVRFDGIKAQHDRILSQQADSLEWRKAAVRRFEEKMNEMAKRLDEYGVPRATTKPAKPIVPPAPR